MNSHPPYDASAASEQARCHLIEKHAEGLRAAGVSPSTFESDDLWSGEIVSHGNRFEFAVPGDPRAASALIHQVRDAGEVIDLVATTRTAIASYKGVAFALGQDVLWIPPFTDPVHVFSEPIDWLREERQGIVIVEPRFARAMMSHRPVYTCDSEEVAAALRDLLRPPAPPTIKEVA